MNSSVAFDRPSPATGRLSLSGVSNLKGESALRRQGLSAPWHKRHSYSHGPGRPGGYNTRLSWPRLLAGSLQALV
jgi:hypothetical protein